KNKYIAWGIIPTYEEKIFSESPESLYDKLIMTQKELVSKGVDRDNIINNTIITPACGVGSLSEKAADKVLELLKTVSEIYKNRT
ncbi:MAG: hypothetical protein KAW92_14035, partial [Candidatus Cloacimonetes bacterium]|nr:hypothetical protein [Candidatus Cloacimonadota bacterium]